VAGAVTNPTLRAEGETELTADLVATCNNAGAATSGALYITTSLPITSKAFTVAGVGSNEATATFSVGPTGSIQGTVSGTQVSFTVSNAAGIPAGAFTVTVSNIRVNASTATNPQVTTQGVLSYAFGGGTSNASILTAGGTPFNSGFVLQSLGATSLVPFSTNNYTACAGNAVGLVLSATNTSFTVNVKELVGGAFKLSTSAATGGEGGSFVAGANIGTASTATQITTTLGNVPASATVYVKQTVPDPGAGGTVLSLANSTAISSGALTGYVGYTPAGGNVSITYTVTAIGSVGAITFPVPVVVAFAANSAAAQGAVTILTAYAPQAALTGPASAIPTFAVSTATPINGSKISICATTLLFPYVTNATGFETGIAIANTTTDNLGTTVAVPSVATPTNGTCTLNFYGNAAQPTATVTPTLGAYTAAAPTVVPIYANILTSMVGSSGFSGYAIAQCNFLDAHGFAFITDTSGTFSGTEGYLATIIPGNRTENNETSLAVSITGAQVAVGANQTLTGTATGIINNTGN